MTAMSIPYESTAKASTNEANDEDVLSNEIVSFFPFHLTKEVAFVARFDFLSPCSLRLIFTKCSSHLPAISPTVDTAVHSMKVRFC